MAEVKTKIVKSKDVLDAISDALVPIRKQKLPVSEVAFVVYRSLARVPEFYADGLTELTKPDPPEVKEQG